MLRGDFHFYSFLRIVFEDIFTEVVVLVALGAVTDGLFHPLINAVKIVQQTLLCLFSGIWGFVDDIDDILDFLTTFPDGIVQRLPLPHLPLFGRKLAARDHQTQGCQYDRFI